MALFLFLLLILRYGSAYHNIFFQQHRSDFKTIRIAKSVLSYLFYKIKVGVFKQPILPYFSLYWFYERIEKHIIGKLHRWISSKWIVKNCQCIGSDTILTIYEQFVAKLPIYIGRLFIHSIIPLTLLWSIERIFLILLAPSKHAIILAYMPS